METDSLWDGWSKKQQDDGTPKDRYATCHCPVILSTCDGHMTGHWRVALFKQRNRRWDTFNCPSLCGSSSRF